MLPATLVPDKVPTLIRAPGRKFDPKIVTDALGVTPYVTWGWLTLVTVGRGAATSKAETAWTDAPPANAGLVTVTGNCVCPSEVLFQKNLSVPELVNTNGVAAVAFAPFTATPD